jgi:hypothetical protein
MLPKPTVPLGPVIVKDTVIDAVGWFGVIVTLPNICWAVMFPSSEMGTMVVLDTIPIIVIVM